MEFSKTSEETEAMVSFRNAMFAFNITKLRKKLGISQKEMAKKLSVSVKLYDEFEHCESIMSITQAYEITYILGVDLGDMTDKLINFENINIDELMRSEEDNVTDKKIASEIIEYNAKKQQEK